MTFERTKKYDRKFLNENMMGPNSMLILEELINDFPLEKGMRVLDLGCGRGLTSIFLAKEYGVQVFALDLWIEATDNYKRFKVMGLENEIIPIHADALNMPFADGFFDAVISVDSYHYFGNNDTFFREKVKPLIKDGGAFAFAFPGMKKEIHFDVPKDMKEFWPEEALPMWQCAEWWKDKIEKDCSEFRIWEAQCFEQAWKDWLSTDNPYAKDDIAMMEADGGRYMNIIAMTGKV